MAGKNVKRPWGIDLDGDPIRLSDEQKLSDREEQQLAADMGLFDCVLVTEDGREYIAGLEPGTYHPVIDDVPDFSVTVSAGDIGITSEGDA